MGKSEDKNQSSQKRIMATVYLRSLSGRSLLQEGIVGTDPKPFISSPQTIQRVISELKKRGFTIEGKGVTLSISGSPELFEKIFKVKISIEEIKRKVPGQIPPQLRFIYHSSKPVMQLKELEDVIEGIILSKSGVPIK